MTPKTLRLEVIRALQYNARLTAAEIAEELEADVAAVAAIMADLDPAKLGREVQKAYGFRK